MPRKTLPRPAARPGASPDPGRPSHRAARRHQDAGHPGPPETQAGRA